MKHITLVLLAIAIVAIPTFGFSQCRSSCYYRPPVPTLSWPCSQPSYTPCAQTCYRPVQTCYRPCATYSTCNTSCGIGCNPCGFVRGICGSFVTLFSCP